MEDLSGKYERLRNELDAAYKAPVWDSVRIDRIADEILPIELVLSARWARPADHKEHRDA